MSHLMNAAQEQRSPLADSRLSPTQEAMLALMQVCNLVSGYVFGCYRGATPEDVIDAACRDAGYASRAHFEHSTGGVCLLTAIPALPYPFTVGLQTPEGFAPISGAGFATLAAAEEAFASYMRLYDLSALCIVDRIGEQVESGWAATCTGG